MKIGYSVINSISNKITRKIYVGIVNHEMCEYKTTKIYNYALDILLIESNYRQYELRQRSI